MSPDLPSHRPRPTSGDRAWRIRSSGAIRLIVLAAALAMAAAACGSSRGDPGPTPAAFDAIVASLEGQGIAVAHVVAGEAGCNDPTLVRAAISFDARGLDQPTPVRVHLYIFGSGAGYDQLLGAVDACASSYAGPSGAYAAVDLSPYVAAGTGPWGTRFEAALRTGLAQAASPDTTGM